MLKSLWAGVSFFSLYEKHVYGKLVLMTLDHISPKPKGGPDSLENSQPVCQPCNKNKQDFDFAVKPSFIEKTKIAQIDSSELEITLNRLAEKKKMAFWTCGIA